MSFKYENHLGVSNMSIIFEYHLRRSIELGSATDQETCTACPVLQLWLNCDVSQYNFQCSLLLKFIFLTIV